MMFCNIFYLILMMSNTLMLFDFNADTKQGSWEIVDDVVMGGKSQGSFSLSAEGHGVFEGRVSLENNGGFSSLRHQFTESKNIDGFSNLCIRVKGDGKRYQIRVKSSRNEYYSYIAYFETNGDWQDIEISLSEMLPTFRGRAVDLPPYPAKKMEEVAFLIANKKSEPFRMMIDKITLK